MKCWNVRTLVLVYSVLLVMDRVTSSPERRILQTLEFICNESHNGFTATGIDYNVDISFFSSLHLFPWFFSFSAFSWSLEVLEEAISAAAGLGADLAKISCLDKGIIGQIPSEDSLMNELTALKFL